MTEVPLKRVAEFRTDPLTEERQLVALEHVESWTGRLLPGAQLGVADSATPGVAAVEPGDVLFGKLRPYLAKALVVGEPLAASTELICLRPRRGIEPRWLGYVAQSSAFIEWAVATSEGSKMPRTSPEKLGSLALEVPPLAEQQAIADYLDAETARIDALIAKKQQLILLLDERVRAMAAALVAGHTVGKPTGIPTIPLVPGDWKVLRNKVFATEVVHTSLSGEEEMLSVSHLTGVTPRSEKTVYMFEAESTVGYKRVESGDLVINTMWAWMGAAGTAQTSGIVSPAYGVYRLDQSIIDPGWMDLVIRTEPYIVEMTRFSRGVTSSRLRLYPDEFLCLSTPLPPMEEQKRRVGLHARLRDAASRLTAVLSAQVQLLGQRRQALISAEVAPDRRP